MLEKLTARLQSSGTMRWYADKRPRGYVYVPFDRRSLDGAVRWYTGKGPRERLTYGVLAVLVALVFVWAGLWKPLADWHWTQTNRHGNAISLVEWLRANESRVRAAVAQGDNEPSRSILPIITRAAEARGLKVGRLQPESGGVVSVTLQGQPFNDVVAWVAALEDSEGITVIRASIDAQKAAGVVNAQLRLQ